ncbi:Protein adenylyltransferase SelO, mitochondrial,Protein adenylyltransferase SelO-1, mitochondrial,Protein adenylyltransferase SelO [Mytilus coruscus]|uniref:Selenoprotein O n=1 Tax=Mytilus coruscus TaxID=42192 RepID=A0A6J8BSE1_MYTCO|nr:Protein adenylyltransferase SelO, mitochondrial,Protein adenylyltransferase SelO-1, mitochondrial,Protein adenylyltransferase SelO [Mytilus coruscus]
MKYVLKLITLLTISNTIKTSNDFNCDNINPLAKFINHDTCIWFKSTYEFFAFGVLIKQQLSRQSFPIEKETLEIFIEEIRVCHFQQCSSILLKINVQLAAVSNYVLSNILDLDPIVALSSDFVAFVGGEKLLTTPLSHRYGGHQFGYWSGQLGDGRAVMIGEYFNQRGERYELQLKGSGLTPYSRRGDGRAVIRSSVREFLCSEAMFYLGIPTSRAASLLVSDDPVVRDMFYDGHRRTERGAIVLRLAESWFRIGSLEILTDSKEYELLKNLTDFVILHYFKTINVSSADRYLEFFSTVVEETACMIVLWQSVGFTHGVCNTDNFSLLSITIDYGPFGFMEEYNPDFVPNTSDDDGRYSYEKQPDVGYFNLNKLRAALEPLLTQQQRKQAGQILNGYIDIYKSKFLKLFFKKLGLTFDNNNIEDDEQLIALLLKMMSDTKSDFTMTFRQLGELPIDKMNDYGITRFYWALKKLSKHKWYTEWISMYKERSFREQNLKTNDKK